MEWKQEKAEVSKGSKANYKDVCKLKENIHLPESKTGKPDVIST